MLTRKQKLFFDRLKDFIRENHYFPSVREIGLHFSLSSPATVHAYLHRLHEKGFLKRCGREWELVSGQCSVPLMGVVPAGIAHEIFEPLGEEVELPDWMITGHLNILGFKVQGESMKDAYIQDGDVVVVQQTDQADTGEMVVALLPDNTITLKRLRRKNGSYVLVPENPDFHLIEGPFQLVGKVVGVLRSYR